MRRLCVLRWCNLCSFLLYFLVIHLFHKYFPRFNNNYPIFGKSFSWTHTCFSRSYCNWFVWKKDLSLFMSCVSLMNVSVLELELTIFDITSAHAILRWFRSFFFIFNYLVKLTYLVSFQFVQPWSLISLFYDNLSAHL